MNIKSVIKIILLVFLYFISTYTLSILQINRNTMVSQNPTITYFILAAVYFVIGSILFKKSLVDSNNSFLCVLSIVSAILLFLPFIRIPKLTVYLLGIHIEILSGAILGFCVSNIKK